MRRGCLSAVSVAIVVLAAGLFVGLRAGGSASSTAASTTSTQNATASGATGVTDTTTSDATATVPTQPMVTVATTPTTATNTLPGTGRPRIQLGDGNTPEQFILGALYYLALQREGYTVSLTRNIGTPQIALAALKQGSLDMFPEYLNQWDAQVAGVRRQFHSLADAYAAGVAYADKHGAILLAPTPFSDTSGIIVTSQYAAANHISSIADLATGPSIIMAAPLEFESGPQSLPAAEHAYGFRPGYVQVVDIGSQYSWLASDNAQAAYATTTDPQLSGSEYKLLSDPDDVFGFGNIVAVTTRHEIALEGPVFIQTIERINHALTTEAMRGLNWEVEVAHHDPTEVASEFLQGQGITPPVIWAPEPLTTTTTTPTGATTTTIQSGTTTETTTSSGAGS